MDFNLEKFSYKLTSLLKANNMTQTQLANKIGVSNVTICRYITCERIPHLDVIIKIASVFNISLDYLLSLSDDKNIKTDNNIDFYLDASIKNLYCLDKDFHLSKHQKELVKRLLLGSKDFILSSEKK